ncbi:hypothetical protein EON63_21895 [archaeon]|nr:MAG: hypothetical protein EON63_21895 [archaeon]
MEGDGEDACKLDEENTSEYEEAAMMISIGCGSDNDDGVSLIGVGSVDASTPSSSPFSSNDSTQSSRRDGVVGAEGVVRGSLEEIGVGTADTSILVMSSPPLYV